MMDDVKYAIWSTIPHIKLEIVTWKPVVVTKAKGTVFDLIHRMDPYG